MVKDEKAKEKKKDKDDKKDKDKDKGKKDKVGTHNHGRQRSAAVRALQERAPPCTQWCDWSGKGQEEGG